MSRTKLFDPKCLELARHFFPQASEQQLMECAGDIQDTVETYGEFLEPEFAECSICRRRHGLEIQHPCE